VQLTLQKIQYCTLRPNILRSATTLSEIMYPRESARLSTLTHNINWQTSLLNLWPERGFTLWEMNWVFWTSLALINYAHLTNVKYVCAFSCSVTCVLPVTGIIFKLLGFISSYMHTAYMVKKNFIPSSFWFLHLLVCILCPDCVAACLPLALIHYRAWLSPFYVSIALHSCLLISQKELANPLGK